MKTIIDKQRTFLIKKFHILLGLTGLIESEDKLNLLSQYGVSSSKDLSAHDLIDICDKLEKIAYPDYAEMDRWRKRLIASIGGWLQTLGREQNLANIKAIACRAAGDEKREFNSIPLERLRSLYYAFSKKTKDIKTVEMLTAEELNYLTNAN
jgi:GH18 family chitinase